MSINFHSWMLLKIGDFQKTRIKLTLLCQYVLMRGLIHRQHLVFFRFVNRFGGKYTTIYPNPQKFPHPTKGVSYSDGGVSGHVDVGVSGSFLTRLKKRCEVKIHNAGALVLIIIV